MALGFIDGFDHYGPSNLFNKWTNFFGNNPSAGIAPNYARGTGQGLTFGTDNVFGIYKTVWPSGSATVTMGVAAYFGAVPATGGFIPLLFMDGTAEQCSVRGDGTGKLRVQRGATVLATSVNAISLNTWYYLEFQATISTTVGRYELRVNGTSVGWIPQSAANQNTQLTANAYATGVGLGAPNGSGNANFYDDFYALDSSGAVNTTFLGDIRVAALRPQAAGNYAQWTSNGGPNFANVADNPWYDGDTTFNQSATANQIDSFVFDDLPAASGSVFGIQHVLWAKKDVGAARTFAALQRSSATDYVGTTQNAGTSYAMYLDVKETNPDTGLAWTVGGVNGAEWGYKILS